LESLGRHILVEYYGCDVNLLNRASAVKEVMEDAARAARATVVESFIHQFSPFGVSGVVVIAESHLTIHTWPERGEAAVDLFTCSNAPKARAALDWLCGRLGGNASRFREIPRGALAPD